MFLRSGIFRQQSRLLVRGIEEFWSPGGPQLEAGMFNSTFFCYNTVRIGRSWYAFELRNKSYEDLHKLWFVLLKEKNLLLTERQQSRDQGVSWRKPVRLQRVKKSMARLKSVENERRLIKQNGVLLPINKSGREMHGTEELVKKIRYRKEGTRKSNAHLFSHKIATKQRLEKAKLEKQQKWKESVKN